MATPEAGQGEVPQGPHRRVPPEETLARLAPHLERMGITRVANVTGLDRVGVPVVTVVRPNARSLAVSQGKGLTLAAAKVSAIMEAVELHHAETVSGPLWWARPHEIGGERLFVDPLALPRSSARVYEAGPIAWIEGEDLGRGGRILVPFACVSADYTPSSEWFGGGLAVTTSGLGAGNDRDEALLHGLAELIERDAVTLWRLGGASRRRASVIDLETIDDPDVSTILEQIWRARLCVRVWDATSDIGIPVAMCLVAGTDPDDADPEFGAGCHARPAMAILRALLEALQARLTFIAGSRDDMGGALYEAAPRGRRRREALRWLTEASVPLPVATSADRGAPTARAEFASILSALAARGIRDVAAVDLTRADIGIPVVRVLVGGLEGSSDAADYHPGRRAQGIVAQ